MRRCRTLALSVVLALLAGFQVALILGAPLGRYAWGDLAYFVLGVVINAVSRSKPERYVMVPVSILLAALSFPIAMGWA